MWCLYFVVLYLSVYSQIPAVESKVYYNSQINPPQGIQFADVDGDGIDEFYILSGDKVYVTTSEMNVHGLAYFKLPATASRVISGKFDGGSKAMLCAQETSLNMLDCYSVGSGTGKQLFSQTDFVGTSDAIVGDFNGDGWDDILSYSSSTGVFQAYVYDTSKFPTPFQPMPNWTPGDVGTTYKGANILVADFGTDGFTDMEIQIGVNTYAFLATSVSPYMFSILSTYAFNAPPTLRIADFNGAGASIFSLTPGYPANYVQSYPFTKDSTAFYGFPYSASAVVFFANLKNVPGEDNGKTNLRDDALIYDPNAQTWSRYDARLVGSVQSYVQNYTQKVIVLNQDQDDDAILSGYELGGYDPNNDGISDCPMHTYGASPFLKDLFVQVDYMAGPTSDEPDYSMFPEAISLAVNIMAENNINLHIFQENMVPFKEDLGLLDQESDWMSNIDPIKNKYLSSGRQPFFHYCLFGRQFSAPDTATGVSRGIVGSDFIVTLMYKDISPDQRETGVKFQVGTFLHELGHNLGLRHGSTDDVNYKPNHLSVMNYNYQWLGIYKNGNKFLYSDIACQDIDESNLNEQTGIMCTADDESGYLFLKFDTALNRFAQLDYINYEVDWNGDGQFKSSGVRVDVNNDGQYTVLKGGSNEYALLNFGGIPIANPKKRSPQERYSPCHPPVAVSIAMFDSDCSVLNHQPHNGIQFLDSKVRYPVDLFESAEHAVRGILRLSVAIPAVDEVTLKHNI